MAGIGTSLIDELYSKLAECGAEEHQHQNKSERNSNTGNPNLRESYVSDRKFSKKLKYGKKEKEKNGKSNFFENCGNSNLSAFTRNQRKDKVNLNKVSSIEGIRENFHETNRTLHYHSPQRQCQRRNDSSKQSGRFNQTVSDEVVSESSCIMKSKQISQDLKGRKNGPYSDGAHCQKSRGIGFRCLQDLSSKEPTEIISFLINSNSEFEVLLNSVLKPDWLILIVKVLAKTCTCEFTENKADLINYSCQTKFLSSIENHMFRMPTDESEERKRSIPTFISDLLFYFETIMNIIPNTASERLKNVFINTDVMMSAVEKHQKVNLVELRQKFTNLNKILQNMIDEREIEKAIEFDKANNLKLMTPPDDFRKTNIFPTQEDLFGEVDPFIRPNIVDGAYNDVEHYLDVQFRLLREDFIAPLREGILQFFHRSANKKVKNRINNIRVYKQVEFGNQRVLSDSVGIIVHFDPQKKMKINWEYSKRFMFGSLLLFTNDNFKNVLFGTVLERDIKELKERKVTIIIQQENYKQLDIFKSKFLMIESEIYFEPYKHVLRALQTFSEHTFPMKKYIISAENDCCPPKYLLRDPSFRYVIDCSNVRVLEEELWPNEVALGLDKTQLEAFKAGLSQEFVIIQGPPGTGKTYLGLKIAKVLLRNEKIWNINKTPILIVCYTNHALDQFLGGLLSETHEIVRVGGQSKCPSLNDYNLRKKRRLFERKHSHFSDRKHSHFFDRKHSHLSLKESYHSRMSENMKSIKTMQTNLEELENCRGIVSVRYLQEFSVVSAQHFRCFCQEIYREDNKLHEWLSQGFEESYCGIIDELDVDKENDDVEDLEEEDPIRLTMDVDPVFFDFGEIKHNIEYAVHLSDYESRINWLLTQTQQLGNKHNQFSEIFEECDYLQQILCYWKNCLNVRHNSDADHLQMILSTNNIWNLCIKDRWLLYKYWLNSLKTVFRKLIQDEEKEFQEHTKKYNEIIQFCDLKIMQNSLVVGMTTTNAARLQTLLLALKPKIVIVEEAAEVLESHVIVTLTEHCEHVILIGDHKQLRPAPTVYKLARKYNLDISLFERMVKNGLPCHCLENQHRMRPEIAQLIAPTIYPNLKNDSSVNNFPAVRGITKSLFFISHNIFEEEDTDTKSHRNRHEADFILGLCRHLILQGYKPEEITVLATYKAQMFYMKQKQRCQGIIANVGITVVDNYQGEENKIILLSLVRSNEEAKIGFLKIENRVCVALSRAKEGLYIIGNMDNLIQSSEIWPKIKNSLVLQESFGTDLILKCEVHPQQLTKVNCASDFKKVPEGGCSLLCRGQLTCGHQCESICHANNREHQEYKCQKKCERTPLECDLQHKCTKLCYETCGECETYVLRTLPCGHTKNLPCYINYMEYKCYEKVEVELPNCGHKVEKNCFNDTASYPCPVPCTDRLPCGHSCTKNCHVVDDPDHIKYECKKPCPKTNAGCTMNHKCSKLCYEDCGLCVFEVKKKLLVCDHIHRMECYEDPSNVLCMKKCTKIMICGHQCHKKCYEECGDCKVKVKKLIPECGHEIEIECGEIPTQSLCIQPCLRILTCGHTCTGICGEKCIENCLELIYCSVTSPCGHNIKIPCSLQKGTNMRSQLLMDCCEEPCQKMLSCGHKCKGTCGDCMQGRIHIPCIEKCDRVLICGHKCKVPCSNMCPPCSLKCEYKCKHSRCKRKCGVPCTPCTEPCDWKCEHLTCNKLCHEPCNRDICYAPCKMKLKCKHDCIGFCGDPCPPLCRICDEGTVKEIFWGTEEDENARFVFLVDCGHTIESEGLERWLKKSDEQNPKSEVQIVPKLCPKCKTPILQTQRFMNYVKETFKDIVRVKRKVFGNMKKLEKEMQILSERFVLLHGGERSRFSGKFHTLKLKSKIYVEVVDLLDKQLQPVVNKHRNYISQTQLQIMKCQIEIFNDLVTSISVCTTKVALKREKEVELFQQFDYLLEKIKQFTGRFCGQVTADFNRECKRFLLASQLSEIESSTNFLYTLTKEEFKVLYQKACAILHSIDIHNDEKHAELKIVFNNLRKNLKNTSLTDRERKEIVQAVGLKQGHWFKCPNGHIYCIGECGGAMEVGRCPECGAAIGGTQHHLLNTNALASEMDGARRHAFPGGLY